MTAPSFFARQIRSLGRSYLAWQRGFAARHGIRLQRKKARGAALALFTGSLCAVTLSAVAMMPSYREGAFETREVLEILPQPDLSAEIEALKHDPNVTPSGFFIRTGETLSSLFARLDIHDEQARDWIRRNPKARAIVNPQPGQFVSAGRQADGRLGYLRLYMEGPHHEDERTIEISRYGEDLSLTVLPFTFTAEETFVSARAGKNFEQTVNALGISSGIREQLEAVWEGEVNPIRDLQTGDRLRLLYEKKYAGDTFVRDGRLLAVQVVRGDAVFEAFRFRANNSESFYTLDGQSSRQTFLRIPLDVLDVSSEYAPLRRHPVTGVMRSHNGTDFRAPSGSRIFAASNGVVTLRSYEKRGYGNYVKIDHGLGRTTLYAHMSRVAKGIRNGKRVKKGDIIGYVGATGLTTGPHLHYELMFDGVQVNPKTADLPDTENLSNYQMAQLFAQAEIWLGAFDRLAQEEGEVLPSALKAKALAAEEAARAAEEAEADEEGEVDAEGTEHALTAPQTTAIVIPVSESVS